MVKKFIVKKLPNGEYEIIHPDGHIQKISKAAVEGSIKEKEQQIIMEGENLNYKKELLKAINQSQ